jgi:hypothetical protein
MAETDVTNPYAPPQARVDDAVGAAPALWNPNAAANWSLLFSPVFGSLLVYLNWKAIGDEHQTKTAQVWLALSIAVLALSMVLDSRAPALPWLIIWYFSSARKQATFVKERYGNNYPRKRWGKPLGIAALAMLGTILVLAAVSGALK